MKNYRGNLLAALAVVALFASCLGNRARDNTLIPSMKVAWVGVKADVEAGVADAVAAGALPDAGPVTSQVAVLDSGLKAGNRDQILGVRWVGLKPYGERGIASRTNKGEHPISVDAAAFLYERLNNFSDAFEKLATPGF